MESEAHESTVEDRTEQHAGMITELQQTVKYLLNKTDEAENRMRCNNVQVLSLPEGAEGEHPADFAETFFKDLLYLPDSPVTYVAERAHQVPMGRYIPGAPPCPFLVLFLNYRDRDRILFEARKHPTLQYGNTMVMFFPDFSQELQKKRKTFNDVRRRLR